MRVFVKKLQGPECAIEVGSSTTVISLKERVANEMQIPVCQQKLVFKGKTLADDQCLKDYNIDDGNKIHLFISENASSSKPLPNQNILWDHLRKYLTKDYAEDDVEKIIEQFKSNLHLNVNDLNLDEIEKIAKFQLNQT